MLQRTLTSRVEQLLAKFPIVGILGPRQVGKTTLAKGLLKQVLRERVYLDLEFPPDLQKLENPVIYLEFEREKCVVIDEVQRMPSLFPLLRSLVDQDRRAGRFLLLGSASPDLLRKSSETLTGRIVFVELMGLNWLEVKGQMDLQAHWLRGGFPEPLLEHDEASAQEWFRSFVLTFLERDLPNLGLNALPVVLSRLVSMLAFNQGGLWNASSYGKSLGVHGATVAKYVDFLEQTFFIRRLQPFYSNAKKRIVKSPKLYIRDSGVLHYLLGIKQLDGLLGNVAVGHSWEGYVIEQIISVTENRYAYYHYRTQGGTECDLVIVEGGVPLVSIEVKLTDTPKRTKSFTNSILDLGTKHNFIVVPNCAAAYPVGDDIWVSSLDELLSRLLPEILKG